MRPQSLRWKPTKGPGSTKTKLDEKDPQVFTDSALFSLRFCRFSIFFLFNSWTFCGCKQTLLAKDVPECSIGKISCSRHIFQSYPARFSAPPVLLPKTHLYKIMFGCRLMGLMEAVFCLARNVCQMKSNTREGSNPSGCDAARWHTALVSRSKWFHREGATSRKDDLMYNLDLNNQNSKSADKNRRS